MTHRTTFILVRHGESDRINTHLVSRSPGIPLTANGREQAKQTAMAMSLLKPDVLFTSPRERAAETASYIGAACSLDPQPNARFEEFDFGEWTGLSFDALLAQPEWRSFNAFRSGHNAPKGESILEVQYRATREMLRLAGLYQGQTVVIVTHADVIRSVLAYFAGSPLDLLLRFAINPASSTAIQLTDDGPEILYVNR